MGFFKPDGRHRCCHGQTDLVQFHHLFEMGFNSQFTATCRWRLIPGVGLEHLHINSCENNIIASSVVIGENDQSQFAVRYTIICAPDWTVRSFTLENTQGNSLALNSDGEGNWFDQYGTAIPAFSGAIEIDMTGTPFTNTLPIRRMEKHKPGHNQRYKILYVPFDTLEPRIDRQQYSCLIPYRKYRYEALGRGFATELEVDNNGVVIDYPGLFTRETPRGPDPNMLSY